MEKKLVQLEPIPVEFVVGHAQAKKTDGQRRPYVELIHSWAEHEKREDDGQAAILRITGQQQTDSDHMPKEFYQSFRQGERAQQLIEIVGQIDRKIASGTTMWTWAHVMRVMVDECILMANISVNRFDTIICSMIPGKGRDTVRKNGRYADIMARPEESYHTWSSLSEINPTQATNREICQQIAQEFLPVLGRRIINL